MGCVREYVSMGSSSEQLQSEVKALSRQEREKLLDSAMSSLRRYMYTF